jgi:eukaryotic-like serine/threonine-protein kinase
MLKLKGKKSIALIFLLVVVTLAVGLVGGCTSGIVAVGWSGGAVSGDFVYVGSNAGRLVSINLADDSILRAEVIKAPASGGLLSCACGGGSAAVQLYGTPLIYNNLVYVAAYNGKIYSYRPDNLAQRWIYPLEGYLQSFVGGIVAYDGKLYVGCSDSTVYAVNAETGEFIAKYKTGGKLWGTPAIDPVNKTLLIGSYDENLYCLNLADLTLKWTYKTEGSIISQPLVDNGAVIFGSFDRNLYSLNAADGALKWKFRGDNWFWSQPVISNGLMYAPCLDSSIYVINPATGVSAHEAFKLDNGVASTPVIVDNLIVAISTKGVLYKIDTTDMSLKTIVDLKIDVDGSLMAYNGIIYIHPQQASLIRVNAISGAVLPAISL